MAFRIQLSDHAEAVLTQMDANVERALTAMGIKAVGLIVRQMESGYTTPHKNRTHGTTSDGGTHTAIRETGDLMRDVSYEVGNSGEGTVDVGNSLISTHAPREGCDRGMITSRGCIAAFQSTHPARGATDGGCRAVDEWSGSGFADNQEGWKSCYAANARSKSAGDR